MNIDKYINPTLRYKHFFTTAGGAAAISAGGALVGNLLGFTSAQQNYKNQVKLMDKAYAQNLEQWNRENEYNTPYMQMQRLQAAGLNPNLVYGNGADTKAANSPQMDAPSLKPYTQFGDMGASAAISAYQQAKVIERDNEVKESQAALNYAQRQKVNAEMMGQLKDNITKDFGNKRLKDTYDDIVRQTELDTLIKHNQVVHSNWQIDFDSSQNEILMKQVELMDYYLAKAQLDNNLTYEQINEVRARINNLFNENKLLIENTAKTHQEYLAAKRAYESMPSAASEKAMREAENKAKESKATLQKVINDNESLWQGTWYNKYVNGIINGVLSPIKGILSIGL